jgi:hypothetical protein
MAEIGGHRPHRQVHLLVGDDRTEDHVDAMLDANSHGEAQVLSISTLAPARCAASAIAGTSCTSKVKEPGDST